MFAFDYKELVLGCCCYYHLYYCCTVSQKICAKLFLSELRQVSTNFAKRKEVNGPDASRIRWRRVANVDATTEIRSLVSRGPENIFYVSNGAASGGLQWQYIVNCHIF